MDTDSTGPSDDAVDPVLQAARAGQEWAIAQLFAAHHAPLVRYLRSQVPAEAEDIASETWLAVARGLRTFEGGPEQFRAWLYTVARHRLIDERRKAKRRATPVSMAEGKVSELESGAPTPEDETVATAAGEFAVRRIVALLPADQAEIILLRVVAGLSVDEVATLLGKKPGTVRVLQHRGLKRLAERLGETNN